MSLQPGGETMSEEALRVTEPVPIDDDFCTELLVIEDAGPCARFVVVARQTCFEDGTISMVVKRKIVLPPEAIFPAIEMTLAYMARRFAQLARAGFLRLVR